MNNNLMAAQDGANETTLDNTTENLNEQVKNALVTNNNENKAMNTTNNPNSSYSYEMACLGSLYDGTFFEDLWSVDEAKNLSMESSRDENRDGNDN